jgi:hypothetical protein
LLTVLAYLLTRQTSPLETPPLRIDGSALNETRTKWEAAIRAQGPAATYQDFLTGATLVASADERHIQAHLMGEALFNVLGLPGIAHCDASFEFGCYHSFFASAVNAYGIEILPEFRDVCKNTFGNNDLPCQHGIGHGVMTYTGYEALEEALVLCESVQTKLEGGCVSGVFMEHNFHTMAAAEQGEFYLRPLSTNVYEPCDQIAERFRPACYHEQVQWWQNHYGNDFKHIGTLCDVLVGEEKDVCFQGVGNYVAAYNLLDIESTHLMCASMPHSEAVFDCHLGAAWLIRGDGSGYEQATELCTTLSEVDSKGCIKRLR